MELRALLSIHFSLLLLIKCTLYDHHLCQKGKTLMNSHLILPGLDQQCWATGCLIHRRMRKFDDGVIRHVNMTTCFRDLIPSISSTCIIRVRHAGNFYVHRSYLAPYSAVFRDVLDPDHCPWQRTLRMRVGRDCQYWVMDDEDYNQPTTQNGPTATQRTKLLTNWLNGDFSPADPENCDETLVGGDESEDIASDDFPTRMLTIKSTFWTHLGQYQQRDNASARRSIFHTLSREPTRPVLYISIPRPAMFTALLKWLYTGNHRALYHDIDTASSGNETAVFDLIRNGRALKVVDQLYEILSIYFLNVRSTYSLSLSRSNF